MKESNNGRDDRYDNDFTGKKRPDDDTTDADHMNYARYMKNDHHPTNAYHPTDGSDVMM